MHNLSDRILELAEGVEVDRYLEDEAEEEK